MNPIQMVDLNSQYNFIKEEVAHGMQEVLSSSLFINGPVVHEFQKDLENYLDVKHVIPCANGTDALYISMKALGLGPGDEVITTSHSWISTSETITQTGAKVVFCDTDKEDFLLDVTKVEDLITDKTKGIIEILNFIFPFEIDLGKFDL